MKLTDLFTKAGSFLSGNMPSNLLPQPSHAKGGVIGTTIDDILFNKTAREKLGILNGLLEPYRQNPWVYASIQAIATNIANAPQGLFSSKRTESGERVEASGSKLLKLLNNPNNILSGKELMLGTIIFLEGWGEAFWVARRDNPTAMPEIIEIVHPSQMRLKVSDQFQFMGWEVRTSKGTIVPLMPWEVIHFKLFNPLDITRGLPRWTSASIGMEANYNADIFNSKQFDDNAILSGVVKVKGELSAPQFRRIWRQFNAKDSEGEMPTRVGILENADLIDFEHIPLSKLDMEFGGLKDASKEEIFAVYKTNPVVLGIFEDVKSMEGTKTAHATWWRECLIPEIEYLEDTINQSFVQWIEPNNEYIWLKEEIDALQDDFDKRLERAEKLWDMGVPFNEINRKLNLGMEESPWGDLAFLDSSKIAVDSVERALELGSKPEVNDPMIEPPNQEDQKAIASPTTLKRIDERVRREVINSIENELTALEKKFESKFKRFVMEARVEVLRELQRVNIGQPAKGALKGVESFIFNTLTARTLYNDILGDAYTEAEESAIRSAMLEVEATVGSQDTSSTRNIIRNRSTRIAISKFTSDRLKTITPTIIDGIAGNVLGEVRDGVLKNETTQEIQARVRKAFNFTQNRSLVVARTESASIFNGARHILHKEAGVTHHEWITAGDDAVRETHAGQDGQIVAIGQPFKNGLKYPNDPFGAPEEVINCRCVAVAVVEVPTI